MITWGTKIDILVGTVLLLFMLVVAFSTMLNLCKIFARSVIEIFFDEYFKFHNRMMGIAVDNMIQRVSKGTKVQSPN